MLKWIYEKSSFKGGHLRGEGESHKPPFKAVTNRKKYLVHSFSNKRPVTYNFNPNNQFGQGAGGWFFSLVLIVFFHCLKYNLLWTLKRARLILNVNRPYIFWKRRKCSFKNNTLYNCFFFKLNLFVYFLWQPLQIVVSSFYQDSSTHWFMGYLVDVSQWTFRTFTWTNKKPRHRNCNCYAWTSTICASIHWRSAEWAT